MVVRTPRRLPGIRFEVQPPPLAEVLPRMDVAVFVGFATAGPVGIPVPVEDAAHFAAVFGPDAPLAWDPERGATVYAYLAPAVRAFFRNGGRRCWVVRVTGSGAVANRFTLPGMVGEHGNRDAIKLQARSVGSWSDTLEVATTLTAENLPVPENGWVLGSPVGASGRLTLVPPAVISAGDLLRLTFQDEQQQRRVLLWPVRGGDPSATVAWDDGHGMWLHPDDGTASPPWDGPGRLPFQLPFQLLAVERLTFELQVRQGRQSAWQLSGLGFVPGHPRYWGDLPADDDLYQAVESLAGRARPLLWDAATDPRFPLAADRPDGRPPPTGFPVSMPAQADDFAPADSRSQPATALERDGLAEFDEAIFFGPDPAAFRSLLEAGAGDLLAEADFLRYQAPSPIRLQGLHAALEIEEATLLAVPDAVHRGWVPAQEETPASPEESSPPARPEWWHFLPCAPPTKIPRVREPEWGHFLDCGLRVVPAPDLTISDRGPAGNFTLTWSSVADATSYGLEEAAKRDFSGAAVVYSGPKTTFEVGGRPPGDYFYRVRAELDRSVSDYSHGVVGRVGSPRRWQLKPVEDYQDGPLLVLHRAMLRLCAARADLLAVLALPEHYREEKARAHAARLASSSGPVIGVTPPRLAGGETPAKTPVQSLPLRSGEAGALSYGALYHPWLIGREGYPPGSFQNTPPDGAAAGILARRALARGAWIAPANEALTGVVALTPDLGRQYRLGLQEARINLLRQEPHGFVTLSADTLSRDEDLRPINVRRLLILLRRLSLRLGATYVFEPNDDAFRRAVQRGFEAQLEYLFARGAFAGGSPETSFQVVTTSVNTPQSVDQGRFIVELRVAPSLPMTFLTVRLVQTGDQGQVTEVR